MSAKRKAQTTKSQPAVLRSGAPPLQAVRSACTACGDCPGFQVWFRAVDANDPGVMLHCALCGCPAHQHSIDQVSPGYAPVAYHLLTIVKIDNIKLPTLRDAPVLAIAAVPLSNFPDKL